MKRRDVLSFAGATLLLPSCAQQLTKAPAKISKPPQTFPYKNISRGVPSAEELSTYYSRFSNWGRWGSNDKKGTLNFIDTAVVAQASDLVVQGRSISLGRPIRTGKLEMEIYRTDVNGRGSAHDTLTVHAHGYTETHIDALNHISSADAKLYNGLSENDVKSEGLSAHGIENFSEGIVTRGILYDITALRNIPFVPIDQPVQGWELEDFARQHGIVPTVGDAAIIHCGRNAFFRAHPNNPNTIGNKPGLNPSVLEFIHAYSCGIMGSDFDEAPNQNNYPTNYSIHHIANPFMGLPTLWNLDLESLASSCNNNNTWKFMLVVAPLIVPGGTGSVVNPLALL